MINQVLFSFEMRKYASFVEMNMILMTITKPQPLLFDSWNMRYTSLKFCNSYSLKNFSLVKALFFPINRFCLAWVFFFLWLFSPYDYRDNPQAVLYSNSYSDPNLSERVKNNLWLFLTFAYLRNSFFLFCRIFWVTMDISS